jgi:hypothetical protein
VLALVAGIAGVAPSLLAARAAPAGLGSTRGANATRAGTRLRSAFIALQVTVGVVLLAGTALFGRSMVEALRVELGFDARPLAVIQAEGPLFEDDREAAAAALGRLVTVVREQPGVEAASWSTLGPLTEAMDRETFDVLGRTWPGRRPSIEVSGVGSGFFTTWRSRSSAATRHAWTDPWTLPSASSTRRPCGAIGPDATRSATASP